MLPGIAPAPSQSSVLNVDIVTLATWPDIGTVSEFDTCQSEAGAYDAFGTLLRRILLQAWHRRFCLRCCLSCAQRAGKW